MRWMGPQCLIDFVIKVYFCTKSSMNLKPWFYNRIGPPFLIIFLFDLHETVNETDAALLPNSTPFSRSAMFEIGPSL